MALNESSHPPHTKRERTRNRLLVAAQQLLLERGAGALGIRDIAVRADVSHATFYNYFETVEEMLENLAQLFAFTHALHLAEATVGRSDPAEIFSISTRQTLLFVAESHDYGHFLFDAGLRIDQLVSGMRMSLRSDLERGIELGTFVVADIDVATAHITGALLGLALALHRGELGRGQIDTATAQLLVLLGVPRDRASGLAAIGATFVRAPNPPLQWPIA